MTTKATRAPTKSRQTGTNGKRTNSATQSTASPSAAAAKATTPETATATVEVETDATAEAETTATTEPPKPVDRFSYDESIVTLTYSFLPVAEPGAERQVVVSVHSKNGKEPVVLPEFIPAFSASDLEFHPAVVELLERYRLEILPKRKETADAQAAALAAKRATPKGKEARPAHVTVSRSTRTVKTQSELANSQLKLEL